MEYIDRIVMTLSENFILNELVSSGAGNHLVFTGEVIERLQRYVDTHIGG